MKPNHILLISLPIIPKVYHNHIVTHILSCHIISYGISSHQIISQHMTSRHVPVMPRGVQLPKAWLMGDYFPSVVSVIRYLWWSTLEWGYHAVMDSNGVTIDIDRLMVVCFGISPPTIRVSRKPMMVNHIPRYYPKIPTCSHELLACAEIFAGCKSITGGFRLAAIDAMWTTWTHWELKPIFFFKV